MNIAQKKGFTMGETMVAITILGFLMTGVMAFYTQGLKATYVSTQRVSQVYNIRKFTQEMVTNASRANSFYLYKSSVAADRVDDSSRLLIDTTTSPPLLLHPAGNFAVFVYYEIPKPKDQALHRVTTVIGYFANPDITLVGSVTKVTMDLTSAPSSNPIEQIMSDNWGAGTTTFAVILPAVRGLVLPDVVLPSTVPSLFYMRDSSNLMVSGQLYMSGKLDATGKLAVGSARVTNDWMTYTDSFNFSITPRS